MKGELLLHFWKHRGLLIIRTPVALELSEIELTLSADKIANWETETLGLWSTFCNRAASTFHVNCHFSLFLVQNKFAFLVLWTLQSRSRSSSICSSIVLFSRDRQSMELVYYPETSLIKNFAQASWSCLFEKTMATVMLLLCSWAESGAGLDPGSRGRELGQKRVSPAWPAAPSLVALSHGTSQIFYNDWEKFSLLFTFLWLI